jgi:hypothetical protein
MSVSPNESSSLSRCVEMAFTSAACVCQRESVYRLCVCRHTHTLSDESSSHVALECEAQELRKQIKSSEMTKSESGSLHIPVSVQV